MEILVCDRCGFELTDKEAILLALDGMEAWRSACRERGEDPRGVFPCKYYLHCQGHMQIVDNKKKKK